MAWIYPKPSTSLQSSRRFGGWRAIAIGLLMVSLAACDKPVTPATPQLLEGRQFPSFMLDFIANSNDAAHSWQGKMLVLNIWATWCAPCRREMPGLDRLSKALDPQRFAVIGLSADADVLLASEFLTQNGITFANFFDQNGKLSRRLGLQVYPETFVISQDRTLVRRLTGLHDWDSPAMISQLEGLYQAQSSANGGRANVGQ